MGMHCIRCDSLLNQESSENNTVTYSEEAVEMCLDCEKLVERAFRLTETDKRVARYYEKILKLRNKAQMRLDKLERLYYQTESPSEVFLRKTKSFATKAYNANLLTPVINAAKKGLDLEHIEEEKKEEMLITEITELRNFLDIPPIELVIYEFLTPNEQKASNSTTNNVYSDFANKVIVSKFLDLDKDLQYKIAFSVVVIIGLISLVLSFL